MTTRATLSNRMTRLGVAAVTALLMIATLVAGIHRHADGTRHDDCAICAVGQAPAQSTVAIRPPSAPLVALERVAPLPGLEPRAVACAVPASRAPPEA